MAHLAVAVPGFVLVSYAHRMLSSPELSIFEGESFPELLPNRQPTTTASSYR